MSLLHSHHILTSLSVLWPLFHYLLWQDVATEYASADSHYPAYAAANAAFARRIAEVYRPGDLIWVHDYHLLLLPRLIRELIPDAVLGLFVHTPFPSSEVYRCLPSESFGVLTAICYLFAFKDGRKSSTECWVRTWFVSRPIPTPGTSSPLVSESAVTRRLIVASTLRVMLPR